MHLSSGLSTYVIDGSLKHITVTTPPDLVKPRGFKMSHIISLSFKDHVPETGTFYKIHCSVENK